MSFFRTSICCYLLTTFACIESTTLANDWSRFRGPNGSGVSTDEDPAPAVWSDEVNLKWKRELPGPGSSCAIIVGNRVFVTSWSGYGLDRDEPGDQANLRRHLTCIDRETGKINWDKTVEPYLPEDEYGGMFAEHGYASHTPVSDGESVFVYFGKTGALAFDMDGEKLWQQNVGTESGARNWGSASSPILYKNLLIVAATAESEALVALDKSTGEEVWRQEASGFNSVWGTPTLVNVDGQRTDLVIAVPGEIWGLNPANGKLRWFCKGVSANSICSSAVTQDGIVYAMESGPGGGGGIAVRAGGAGDVSESHVLWSGKQPGRIGSPLVHDGKIYTVSRGVLNCVDAKSGEEIYQGRLKATTTSRTAGNGGSRSGGGRRGRGGVGGQDYSSSVLADGKIYFTSRGGDIHVLEAGEQFKQISANRVTQDAEDFSATPAVSQGELFIRTSKHLYCVSKLEEGAKAQAILDKASQDADNAQRDTQVADAAPPERGRGGRRGSGRGGFDPASIFKSRDANSDGKLTGDEIAGPLKDNLDRIDSNKDGAVTLEELQNGIRRMYSRGGRGGNSREGLPKRPQRPVLDE